MLHIDLSPAQNFLDPNPWRNALEKAKVSHGKVVSGSGPGSEWLGWRRLLAERDTGLLNRIVEASEEIRSDADLFIVCGIGGSYLGARAVIDALGTDPEQTGTEVVFAGNQMSGIFLDNLLKRLNTPKADGSPKRVYLNVISKSGTTLEPALTFRVLRGWLEEHWPEETGRRIICTTGPSGGALNPMAEARGYRTFEIPDDVGGRFSVLTPVGLLPAAVAGLDIHALFDAAADEYIALEENPEPAVAYAALRYALHEEGKAIDLFAVMEPSLHGMGRWMQQLLGESEGKEGKGLFPVVSTYSTDLHSIGQMVQQGRRNLMETFIHLRESPANLEVPETEEDGDGLNYLAGSTMHEINTRALEGTMKAHGEGGVPCISVALDRLDEENIGRMIYFYELVTAIYGYCLDVNPFDQPGVEDYKKAMYELLGKSD